MSRESAFRYNKEPCYFERFDPHYPDACAEIFDKIPYVNFPSDWSVRVLPPFGGVDARFYVRDHESSAHVSVFLDIQGSEGPYWEIYPGMYVDGFYDIYRVDMEDVEGLISSIRNGLRILKEYPDESN